MRSPCTQSPKRNAPVPTGAWRSPSALSGATITASPQAILKGKLPSGSARVTRTVRGSTASTASMPSKRPFCAFVESSARARSRENTTSRASIVVPSWNVTPSWSAKV